MNPSTVLSVCILKICLKIMPPVSGYEKSTVNDMITAWKNGRETVPLAVLSVTSEKIPRIEGEIDYKME